MNMQQYTSPETTSLFGQDSVGEHTSFREKPDPSGGPQYILVLALQLRKLLPPDQLGASLGRRKELI